MRDIKLKYTQSFIVQISQNVACNRLHQIDRRFARWLVEVADRVQSSEFPLTHEFISQMLGVRRASVIDAARRLKEKGLIDLNRRTIKITDIHALEGLSCECYMSLKDEYDRLLPPH
jgi:CRP-like cAMP-binding protein